MLIGNKGYTANNNIEKPYEIHLFLKNIFLVQNINNTLKQQHSYQINS